MLTQEMLRSLVDYNPTTGVMTWLARGSHNDPHHKGHSIFNSKYAGKPVGTLSEGYLITRFRVKSLDLAINTKVHRLVWLYVYGEWPFEIDHVNGDRCDNRLSNLREVDRRLNNKNLKKPSHNTSGLAGVHFDKSRGKWQVQVKDGGKRVFCKRYPCLFSAACALISFRNSLGFTERHGR